MQINHNALMAARNKATIAQCLGDEVMLKQAILAASNAINLPRNLDKPESLIGYQIAPPPLAKTLEQSKAYQFGFQSAAALLEAKGLTGIASSYRSLAYSESLNSKYFLGPAPF